MNDNYQKDVQWDAIPNGFLGRNGSGKCGGIILSPSWIISPSWIRPVCLIHPITSKGLPGRCKITVPYNEIDNVIAALQEFKAKLDEKQP